MLLFGGISLRITVEANYYSGKISISEGLHLLVDAKARMPQALGFKDGKRSERSKLKCTCHRGCFAEIWFSV